MNLMFIPQEECLLLVSLFKTFYEEQPKAKTNTGVVQQTHAKMAEPSKTYKTERLQKHELEQYKSLSFEQLKAQLEQDGYDLRSLADEKTKSLISIEAGVVMVDEEFIDLDEVISTEYHEQHTCYYMDNSHEETYDGYSSEKADIYGNYEKDDNCPTVYDYEDSEVYTTYIVTYARDNEEKKIEIFRDGSVELWMTLLLRHVKSRGNFIYKST